MEYLRAYSKLQFQQDNADGLAAAFTRQTMVQYDFQPVFGPSSSPYLNPIDTLWDDIKYWIQENDSTIH